MIWVEPRETVLVAALEIDPGNREGASKVTAAILNSDKVSLIPFSHNYYLVLTIEG